ncbi:unnamed protein product [Rangifer tarandus platyrhynchus]|uniref:Uncharacterized protein n=1 Tax=Rangifer tarandus platyrhynchus TaxID=3082113 RepID=A0AC59Y4A8_RANTA
MQVREGSAGTAATIPRPRAVQGEGPAPGSRQVGGSIGKGQVKAAGLEEGVVGQGKGGSHRKEGGRVCVKDCPEAALQLLTKRMEWAFSPLMDASSVTLRSTSLPTPEKRLQPLRAQEWPPKGGRTSLQEPPRLGGNELSFPARYLVREVEPAICSRIRVTSGEGRVGSGMRPARVPHRAQRGADSTVHLPAQEGAGRGEVGR